MAIPRTSRQAWFEIARRMPYRTAHNTTTVAIVVFGHLWPREGQRLLVVTDPVHLQCDLLVGLGAEELLGAPGRHLGVEMVF